MTHKPDRIARTLTLSLPFPPSVNTYWRHIAKGKLAGRTLISEKGRAYRASVVVAVISQALDVPTMRCRIAVRIDAYPPDLRKRDLDNIPKGLLDALTHAQVWDDDSQIDRLTIERHEPVKSGRIDLTVEPIAAMSPELSL